MPRRLLVTVAAVAVACVTAGCGDDEPSTTTTTATPTASSTTAAASTAPSTVAIEVVGGGPKDGVAQIEGRVGERLRLVVTSDVADEVHVHGYDRRADVAPGAPATIELTLDIPGQFEVELEKRHRQLAELQVR